jgi:hypothetical protein
LCGSAWFGKWKMENGKWKMENGKWKVEINGLGRFAVWGGILKK